MDKKDNRNCYIPGQLSLFTISGKTNDPIFKKLSDSRIDRRADGQE